MPTSAVTAASEALRPAGPWVRRVASGGTALDRVFGWYYALSRWADMVAATMTFVIVVAFTIAVSTQVFMRYVMNQGLPWPEEFARFALVWLTFIAGSCALRRGYHIGIDYFVEKLPWVRVKALFKLAVVASIILLLWVIIDYGTDLAQRASRRTTPGMGISQGWFHTGVVLGAYFMLIQAIELGLRAIQALVDPVRHAADAAPAVAAEER
ncbi:MAG: TRAP transporter small permease [Geminicoccaceae bacterium]|nr:MAG: TRAP transporter small permease [Geminicoccaceae bacterium]